MLPLSTTTDHQAASGGRLNGATKMTENRTQARPDWSTVAVLADLRQLAEAFTTEARLHPAGHREDCQAAATQTTTALDLVDSGAWSIETGAAWVDSARWLLRIMLRDPARATGLLAASSTRYALAALDANAA
jgi:hypothetical protein